MDLDCKQQRPSVECFCRYYTSIRQSIRLSTPSYFSPWPLQASLYHNDICIQMLSKLAPPPHPITLNQLSPVTKATTHSRTHTAALLLVYNTPHCRALQGPAPGVPLSFTLSLTLVLILPLFCLECGGRRRWRGGEVEKWGLGVLVMLSELCWRGFTTLEF